MPEQHVPSSNRAGSGEKIKISFRGRTQNSFGKRRKIVRFCPLWDGCDKNLSAILGNLNQRSDSVADIGDFNDPAPITSPLVLQASSLAQSWPEEAARWAAALPPGKEYAAWMSPSGTRQRPLDSLRQFTVTQSSHVLVAAEIKSVGFMAIEKTGAPFAGSARCSLLGEA